MKLYRIVQDKKRSTDLSGTGAFRLGGRWNSKGTYILYTSENSSLAFLENIVHFDKTLIPPALHIVQLDVDDTAPFYSLRRALYPADWTKLANLENKRLGDKWMNEKKYFGIKVKSAINTQEYNYLLNPLFPGYNNLLKVSGVTAIDLDERLIKIV